MSNPKAELNPALLDLVSNNKATENFNQAMSVERQHEAYKVSHYYRERVEIHPRQLIVLSN